MGLWRVCLCVCVTHTVCGCVLAEKFPVVYNSLPSNYPRVEPDTSDALRLIQMNL